MVFFSKTEAIEKVLLDAKNSFLEKEIRNSGSLPKSSSELKIRKKSEKKKNRSEDADDFGDGIAAENDDDKADRKEKALEKESEKDPAPPASDPRAPSGEPSTFAEKLDYYSQPDQKGVPFQLLKQSIELLNEAEKANHRPLISFKQVIKNSSLYHPPKIAKPKVSKNLI